jgi:hypothetical protein
MSGIHEHTTPIADEALRRDLLIVPRGTGEWLRQTERRARHVLSRAESAKDQFGRCPELQEAVEALRKFVDDGQSGTLRRLVGRSLDKVSMGSITQGNLASLANGIIERTEAAIELQAELDGLREDIEADLPTFTAEHLERARLTEPHLVKVRTSKLISPMRMKLERVREILAGIAAHVEFNGSERASSQGVVPHPADGPTITELRATAQLYLKDRNREITSSIPHLENQRVAVRHLRTLASIRETAGEESLGPAAAIVERLTASCIRTNTSAVAGAQDTPLWLGMLSGSHNRLFPRDHRQQWASQLGVLVNDLSTETSIDGTVSYQVIPFSDRYSLISPTHASTIKVWSRAIRVGADVEVQTVQSPSLQDSPELYCREIAALFDGILSSESGWYRTVQRARLRVAARLQDGWIAKLEQRGRVSKLEDVHPWTAQSPDVGAIRVFGRPKTFRFTNDRDSARVGDPHAESSFMGMRTIQVRTPFAGDEIAWMRDSHGSSTHVREALEREAELFFAIHSDSNPPDRHLVIEPLGGGRLTAQRKARPMYAVPLALRHGEIGILDTWIRRSDATVVSVLSRVARIMVAAWNQNWALGSCHLRNFAYGVHWPDVDQEPVPHAILHAAPLATPFGTRLPSALLDQIADEYERLHLPVVLPAMLAGEATGALMDAIAFAMFSLDLLITQAPMSSGAQSASHLRFGALTNAGATFSYLPLAYTLAQCIERRADEKLLQLVMQIANGNLQSLDAMAGMLA